MSNNNPSLNPADNYNLTGSITFAFKKMLQSVQNMLPAQVIQYDRASNRVGVQLLINLLTTDGTQVPRPQLSSIPVFIFGGGGFRISFPLNTGDKGWVLANDRDISLFLQSYSASAPNSGRIKSFSDGIFFPDVMNGLGTISGEDANNLVIQSTDGTVTISLSDDTVTINAPVAINMTTPVLAVTGNITATGSITPGV
jgi:hypothetical protein